MLYIVVLSAKDIGEAVELKQTVPPLSRTQNVLAA